MPTIRGKYRAVVQQVATGRFEDSVVQLAALEGIVDIATVAGDDFSAEERFEIDRALIVLMQNSSNSADSGENALNYMNDEALLAIEASLKLVFRGFSRDPQLLASLLRFFFIEPLADAAAGVVSVDNNRSKMEQLVSVFLHSFLACQQESCLQLVRDSLSLFISDAVIAIRDEIIPHDSLGKILENLFGICQRFLLAIEKAPEAASLSTAYLLLVETAFACTCCELLKLGSSEKLDKLMRKDFVKTLSNLTLDWLQPSEAQSTCQVLEAVDASSRSGFDKASEKLLTALLNQAKSKLAVASEIVPSTRFLDAAPGLRVLADIEEAGDDGVADESMLQSKRKRRSKRASSKATNGKGKASAGGRGRKKASDSEDEEDEEDDDETECSAADSDDFSEVEEEEGDELDVGDIAIEVNGGLTNKTPIAIF